MRVFATLAFLALSLVARAEAGAAPIRGAEAIFVATGGAAPAKSRLTLGAD